LELEVVMNEALPLCVAAERERKPNSQRTAACVRVLDAFGKVLGPEDSKLQQQYRLIVNELRRALYSPEITASDVQRYATKGSNMQVDVTLEQIPYHELCHDLQADKDKLEDTIDDLRIMLKNKEHELREMNTALEGQKAVVEQHAFMKTIGINRKNFQKRQVGQLQKENATWELEYHKKEDQVLEMTDKRDQWRKQAEMYKDECEHLRGRLESYLSKPHGDQHRKSVSHGA
jgi:chromosome segregation ATPase